MRRCECEDAMKRCIHSVMYDLLKSIQRSRVPLKSRICRSSNLPLDRCSGVLELMEKYGLVYSYHRGGRKMYEIAERGYVYIGVYERLLELLPLTSFKSLKSTSSLRESTRGTL
ncbi:MAG: hypothetical protein ACO2OR_06715 [Desulfurococcaceae archaeon]